jgi:hypothetical protein
MYSTVCGTPFRDKCPIGPEFVIILPWTARAIDGKHIDFNLKLDVFDGDQP